jgi:antitoxin CcdA
MGSFAVVGADLLDAHKKKMSLSISEPLAALAREFNINLSRAAENGILQEVQRRRDAEWLARNQPAIDAYNRRIEAEGLFGDEHRNF